MKKLVLLLSVWAAGCGSVRAPSDAQRAPVREGGTTPPGETAKERAMSYERILGSFTARSEIAVYATPPLIAELANKETRTVEVLSELVDAFERRGATRGAAAARLNHGAFLWSIGRAEDAYEEMSRARAAFESTGDLDGTARAHEWLGWFFKESGETEAAEEHLAVAFQLFTKLENHAAKKRVLSYAE